MDPRLEEQKMDMRDDPLENLSDVENGAIATDELRVEDNAEERQVQKRVFSSFNLSYGRSKYSQREMGLENFICQTNRMF